MPAFAFFDSTPLAVPRDAVLASAPLVRLAWCVDLCGKVLGLYPAEYLTFIKASRTLEVLLGIPRQRRTRPRTCTSDGTGLR